MGAVPVTWHLKEPLSPRARSTDTGFRSKKGGTSCSEKGEDQHGDFSFHALSHGAETKWHQSSGGPHQWSFHNEEGNVMRYSPERMSLALDEAVPRGLEAEQLYWPTWLWSVCKIWRVATLWTKDVCKLESSFKSTPSLYQDTWRGSEPLMRHSNATGKPRVSWTSFSFLAKEGGSLRSVRKLQIILI